MGFTKLRLLLAALIMAFAFAGATTITEAENPVLPQQTTQTASEAAPPPLRHNCSKLYSRADHKSVAKKYYSRDRKLRKREAHWLWKLRYCQHTDRAQANALKLEHRLKRARNARLAMYCGTPSCNRRLMFYMADRRFGRGGGACLDPIISQESGYHVDVNYGGARGGWNGRGAYGIPQANPGSKMASAGADWEFNPKTQIRWLLNYVASRFGGPCGALAYKRSHGTY
jgi:hypothetical protein